MAIDSPIGVFVVIVVVVCRSFFGVDVCSFGIVVCVPLCNMWWEVVGC